MNGAELHAFIRRRLAIEGLESDLSRDELMDYATAGVETVSRALSQIANPPGPPHKEWVTLVQDGNDGRLYAFPSSTNDPIRVIQVRETENDVPLVPGADENDDGHYVWRSHREVYLADGLEDDLQGVEVQTVLFPDTVTEDTDEADINLPPPAHRAAGYYAALLALTRDENSSAQGAVSLFERELGQLEIQYGEFDDASGAALREVLLANYGRWMGDSIY